MEPTETKKLPEPSQSKKHRPWLLIIILSLFFIFAAISIYRTYFAPFGDAFVPELTATPTGSITPTTNGSVTPVTTKKPGPKSSPTSKPGPNPPPLVDNTLNFFVDTANYLQGRQKDAGISRWAGGTIYIKIIEGSPTATEQSVLNQFISDFNGQSSSTKLQLSTTVATNIRVFFLPTAEIQQMHGGDNIDGFTEWSNYDDCSLQEARVFISNDPGNSADFQTYLLRHEMTHALGFWGHSNYYSESIMAVSHSGYNFPAIDQSAIKMLYNSGLALCSREAATRQFFATHPIP